MIPCLFVSGPYRIHFCDKIMHDQLAFHVLLAPRDSRHIAGRLFKIYNLLREMEIITVMNIKKYKLTYYEILKCKMPYFL